MSEPGHRPPSFGVYIHWPFCAQKCPYCDFNSHVRHQGWDEARFLAAYTRELDYVAALIGPRTVSSIFFGGGTPSLMKPATTAAILDHVARLWTVEANAEITLEANPGSVEAERFAGYRSAGVNRVSMGVQSLRDDQLKRLGRIHTVAEAKAAFEIARSTFGRFSFDLIYARPGQTPQDWRRELAEALALAGRHLSLYQLTIEPDTPYAALAAAGKLVVPDNDTALALYEITQELTGAAGLPAYEISNHASPGEESQHNLLYWRYGEYAGIGPGAHGRIIFDGARHATAAERNPEAWAALVEAQDHGFSAVSRLTRSEQADEMLLMGLRLEEGLDLDRLEKVGGVQPGARVIDELTVLGLLERVTSEPSSRRRQGPVQAKSPAQSEKHKVDVGQAPAYAGVTEVSWTGIRPLASDGTSCPARPEARGLTPSSRIRATGQGRFILNELVLRLSHSFEPVPG